MAVIIYARVSTPKQAESELSIPAQLRLAERYAKEHGWAVAGKYQDIGSGKELRGRPGLIAAISQAKQDRSVSGLVVHKIDRLSRNVFNYLVIKGKLQAENVRIYSVVEGFEASPMGEFIEHIMAAQAEFYSANLASEVRKGLEERLLRGRWNGAPPVGYLVRGDRIVLDPARASRVRETFELWAKGDIGTEKLADEMYGRGLVGQHGKKIRASSLCRLLKNPFYAGIMLVKGKEYPGIHPPIVPKELYERAQEVFRQKVRGRHARKHLVFLLAQKVRCPRCAATLIGEHHLKKSGKAYDYYRCHEKGCGFVTRAKDLDEAVCRAILGMNLPERLGPVLRRKVREAKRAGAKQQTERVRTLRQRRHQLDERLRSLADLYLERKLDEAYYDHERETIAQEVRATEWLLAKSGGVVQGEDDDRALFNLLNTLEQDLLTGDVISKKRAIDTVADKVEMGGAEPAVIVREVIKKHLPKERVLEHAWPEMRQE